MLVQIIEQAHKVLLPPYLIFGFTTMYYIPKFMAEKNSDLFNFVYCFSLYTTMNIMIIYASFVLCYWFNEIYELICMLGVL